MPVQLDDHQLKAVGEIHNGCIVKGGVGTGKSRTALAYAYTRVLGGSLVINGKGEDVEPTSPRDIYVITTAKKRDDLDWESEAVSFRISRDPSLSVSGIKLVVDSWNNITQHTDVRGAFFIFDEQRLVGSGAWVKAFLKIAKANQWIVLSATPGDTWLDYAPIFIANGYYENRTQFIRQHVVYSNFSKFPKIDRYVETGRLGKLRQRVLVEMPFERHTRRIPSNIIVGYDEALFERVWKDRWHVYEDRPIRDVAEMFAVARKVVNSDPSRLAGVMRLMEKHPRLIIFYNFNYELEMLRSLQNTLNIKIAEWNGHKHEPIPERPEWLYLVQYNAGSEGWNCITTDATTFYSLTYSWKQFEQSHGRIDRLNTPYTNLFYYIFRSASPMDKAIAKALAQKKSFNVKKFTKDWEPFPIEEKS